MVKMMILRRVVLVRKSSRSFGDASYGGLVEWQMDWKVCFEEVFGIGELVFDLSRKVMAFGFFGTNKIRLERKTLPRNIIFQARVDILL